MTYLVALLLRAHSNIRLQAKVLVDSKYIYQVVDLFGKLASHVKLWS